MDTIMDTINADVLDAVAALLGDHGFKYIHTITINLNGEHGGADVTLKGFDGNDVSRYNERTVKTVIW